MSDQGSSTASSPSPHSIPLPTDDTSPDFRAVASNVNGLLSPRPQPLGPDAIGASVPLPLSPRLTSPTPGQPASRLLTRSPSPSPARQHLNHDIGLSTVSLDSPPLSASPSSSPSPSPRSSPSLRFIPFKPALPSATIALNGQIDDGVDTSAPFESIELNTTPPPVSTPTLPSSPAALQTPNPKGKRKSWAGFGIHKDDDHKSASSPALNRKSSTPQASRHTNGVGVQENDDEPEAGPSTPPRLHAPPAHPHPYPLPSISSPPISEKRLSIASNHSNGPGTSHSRSGSTGGAGAQLHALGVKGTSTFEKVISHTRPSWLPPKDKIEDETHYHQWEEMMAQSREHEKERRRVAEARRLEKEKRLAINTPRWETLLSGDFSVSKVKEDGGLRRLWFEGVPSHLRGRAWSLAIGNPLAMAKDSYKSYLARARKALDSGRFPQKILDQMETDMDNTLPILRLYVRGSPMRDDLREFVCTWIVYRSDEGLGYAPYITHISAMLLLSSPPPTAFLSLVNLLSRPCLQAFYTQTVDEIEAYYRVFENLQADMFPKIYANCKNLGLRLPESYFRSIFLEQIPFEACCRLWDQIVLDGDGYIFRSALAIFGFLEPRLHYPDHDEILSVLEGRNEATLAIQERERERAKLRGEAYSETVDGKLSVFGINEGVLFEWLDNDGWRESRFERLVSREMPD